MHTLEERIDRARAYFNESGFYVVTSPGQQEAVDELVKAGELQQVKPEWFLPGFVSENFYVHASITCKNQMPVALHKRIVERPKFRNKEFAEMEMKMENGQSATVIVQVRKALANGRYEVSVFGSFTCLYVDEKDLQPTYDE